MHDVGAAPAHELDDNMRFPVGAALEQFVRKLGNSEKTTAEERAAQRFALVVPVHVVPLDRQMRPTGAPFIGQTQDISTGGLAFVHTAPISTDYCLVTIDTDEICKTRLLMKVVRRRRSKKAYEFAGPFVARVGE